MKSSVIAIFGEPIPTALLSLAQAVNKAIVEAEKSTEIVQDLSKQISEKTAQLNQETERRLDVEYLHPRNYGGHLYPSLGYGTSDCKYCKCWMGGFRSGGPDGVDPHGGCPDNPKLRDAYELLLKKKS